MIKQTIRIGENKAADQISCAGTAQLICAFVFATQIVQFFSFLNPKFQACIYDCTARFVSDLVETQIVGFLAHVINMVHYV